jgi:hypothetical protein
VTEFPAVIDRFEGDFAVLLPDVEAAEGPGPWLSLIWPRSLLPAGAGEGSHVVVTCRLDPEATEKARRRVEQLLRELQRLSRG